MRLIAEDQHAGGHQGVGQQGTWDFTKKLGGKLAFIAGICAFWGGWVAEVVSWGFNGS